jgi:hypothetical protein
LRRYCGELAKHVAGLIAKSWRAPSCKPCARDAGRDSFARFAGGN